MAERDANRPQLDFPDLIAELITQLRLTGQVGVLDFSDTVIPAFLIGSRGITFGTQAPVFTSSEVFSGSAVNPAIGAVIFDTGPLAAGEYDVFFNIQMLVNAAGANSFVQVEHRNAANAATLATLGSLSRTNSNFDMNMVSPLFGYTVALNERIRFTNGATALIGTIAGSVFMTLRPTP